MTTDHATRITQALHTITTCWDDMLPTAPKRLTTGTIGRTTERALPIPTHILDTRAATCASLAYYAMYTIHNRDLNPGDLLHDDAVRLANFLKPHATWLAADIQGPTAADTLADHAHRIDRIVDPQGPAEFVGPCPTCGHDLRAREGTATCQGCKATLDAATIRENLVDAALDRIMPAYEILTLAPRLWPHQTLTKVHMSRWSTRGDLPVAAHVACQDGRMRPGYRVRDVETLLNRRA